MKEKRVLSMKPVRAWAIVEADGSGLRTWRMFRMKRSAQKSTYGQKEFYIVRVEIREVKA